MKNILRIEFKRAFTSNGFFLALILGGGICIAQIATDVIPLVKFLNEYFLTKAEESPEYPGLLYSNWIGGHAISIFSGLYFLILPILAALPFGTSLFDDGAGGSIKNICIRVDKRDYYIAKYLATFISGGAAAVLPLILNFLLAAMCLPSMKPEVSTGNSPIFDISAFPDLYYNFPLLYVILFLCFIFLFSGAIACFALISTYHVSYRFLVLMSSFLLYLFIAVAFDLFGLIEWNPMNFLRPSYTSDTRMAILVELSAFIAMNVLGMITAIKRKDIF